MQLTKTEIFPVLLIFRFEKLSVAPILESCLLKHAEVHRAFGEKGFTEQHDYLKCDYWKTQR